MIPGWHTRRRHSLFEILIFKYVYFDTMIDVTVKKREQRIGMLYVQHWERRSVQNPKINWKENSRVRIGRIAFSAEASNLYIWRYSCNPKTTSGLFNQEWWITQKFLTIVQFIFSVDWARDHYSIAEAGLEILLGVYTLVQREDKHFLHRCTICFDNHASEAEAITDTKKSRKVNHQIHWRPEQNAMYWSYLSATQKRTLADKVQAMICASLYAGRMRCTSCQRK